LLSSLEPGTGVSESDVNVSVKRQANETILFFRIDAAHVCKDLGIKDKEPRCDYLAFYKKDDKTILCLVELKGKNIEHAVEQIAHTYKRLNELLKQRACDTKHITWKAYVGCNAHSPLTQSKQPADKLKALFGHNNFNIVRDRGRENMFGQFLRG
jgi:hypothetical protein